MVFGRLLNYLARHSQVYHSAVNEKNSLVVENALLRTSREKASHSGDEVNEAIKRTQALADRQYNFVTRYAEIAHAADEARARLVQLQADYADKEKGYQAAIEQLEARARGLELQLGVVGLDLSKTQQELNSRNNLVFQQRKIMQATKRVYDSLRAGLRRAAHNSCSEDNRSRREAVFVINHNGRITAQSERAIRSFGNLVGKDYSVLVGGSPGAKREAEKYFSPSEDSSGADGLIYLKSFRNPEAPKVGRYDLNISHKYVTEPVEGKNIKVRHSTVLKVSGSGMMDSLAIRAGKKNVLQGALIHDAEAEDKLREQAHSLIAKIQREHGTSGA